MRRWIGAPDALESAAGSWRTLDSIGLDTEFTRISTFWPELALVQIAGADDVALIDALAFDVSGVLGPLLSNAAVIKIIHSASEDLVALAPLCGGRFAGLFDTQIAASFAGLGAGVGYRKLVEVLLGVAVPKDETRSDWRRRPLSAQQLDYAEADVLHLSDLRRLLEEKIVARGMMAWFVEDCDRLASTAARLDEMPANPHWEFKGAARWPRERQARLKRLLEFRERLARRIDRPRQWIIDNETAVALASDPAPDEAQVARLLAAQKSFPKSERSAFPDWLATPLSREELEIEPVPGALEGDDKRAAESLRTAVERRAGELDLPTALVAPRRVIEAIVRGHEAPELSGWRGALLRELA